MALEAYEADIMRCNRCSYCKHVPHDAMKDARFTGICPSMEAYLFHSRSAGGRLVTALALLQGRITLDAAARDIIYQCQMCGGCDVSCKVERDLEPYEIMQELRIRCVEKGVVPPAYLPCVESLKKAGNTLGAPRARRGGWAEGLGAKDLAKEKAEVLFFAGCKYSFEEGVKDTVRKGLEILMRAGLDVGILGKAEICCGGRSYEMGFAEEMADCARKNIALFEHAGVKTIVTPCADCFQSFKVLYDKAGRDCGVEILHLSEMLRRLVREGKLAPAREVPVNVTYHDPCHLGRLAEPWVHWQGEVKKVYGQMLVHDPPKPKRFGTKGVYDAPREILASIPGLRLTEMHRIREYSWCCGAGSGVVESYPDFAFKTAGARVLEARSVGAEAIATSCPRCKENFSDYLEKTGGDMRVYDIVDLLHQAL